MTLTVDSAISRIGELLTREHVSRFDPYIKWVRHPLAVLTLALVAATLCGFYLHPRALVLAAALAAVLAGGTIWPWLTMRGLSGTVRFARGRIREGESVIAHLAVRNRMPWAAWGLSVRGDSSAEDSASSSGMAFAAGWHLTEARWELIPRHRGEYPGEAVRIASAFPFGLWEASQPLAVPARLLVWPRTFPVGPIPEAATGLEGEGLAYRDKAGTTGDLLGVRPYRQGDSLRRVHWGQSVRYGHLIVCEVEEQAIPRVQIVLDTHPEGHTSSGPDGSLEWAIRLAASFAEGWIGQGAEVEVVHGDRSVATTTGPVKTRQARILDALARLQFDHRLPLAAVLDRPICRRFSDGLRLVIATDRVLRDLPPEAGLARDERYVILSAVGFAGPSDRSRTRTGQGGQPLPGRPSIWIDDPSDAPGAVRRGWREVSLDR